MGRLTLIYNIDIKNEEILNCGCFIVELSPTDLISIMSILGAGVAGWALREFTIINKNHDELSKNINNYMQYTDEKITKIKVDIAKIQTSLENIEGMIKRDIK